MNARIALGGRIESSLRDQDQNRDGDQRHPGQWRPIGPSNAFGDDNTGRTPSCPFALEGDFDGFTEVFEGGTVSGALCYEVPADQLDSLVAYLRVDPFGDELVAVALG